MTKQENSKPQAGGGPADTAAPSPALGPAPVGGPAAPNGPRESDGPVDAKPRDNLVVGSIVIASIGHELGPAWNVALGIRGDWCRDAGAAYADP